MPLLDRYLPDPQIRQVHHVAVAADVAHAYDVMRNVDVNRIAFARRLFALRVLPDRVASLVRRRPWQVPPTLRIDDLTHDTGFQILAEEAGREVVVGGIGKVWKARIPFVEVAPEEFAAFSTTGFVKVAWSLRVDPREAGGAWITFDLRVRATDAASRARFRPYWMLIGKFSHAIRDAVMRLFVRELGTPAHGEQASLPGDSRLPRARFQKTHEILVEAPPSAIWPWLVQMGARRAGWYSWDALDNGGKPSARRIHPELQALAVGDTIPALPWTTGGFGVLELEPGRSLVIGDPALLAPDQPGLPPITERTGGPPWRTTWAFVLDPIGDNATRLVVRVRAHFDPSSRMRVIEPLMATLHEVMERRQLHNLKARAEARAL